MEGSYTLAQGKSRLGRPNLRLNDPTQGCTAIRSAGVMLWDSLPWPALGCQWVPASAAVGPAAAGLERREPDQGRSSSLPGRVTFYANAWEQLPCRCDSFPALVSHSGQASLAKAFFSPSLASPPSLPHCRGLGSAFAQPLAG